MATLLQCSPLAAPTAAQQRCMHGRALVTPCKRATIARRSIRVSAAAAVETAQVSPKVAALTNLDRVSILAEALPYLQRFAGKTIVVKYGGAAMKDPALKAGVITDLKLLWTVRMKTEQLESAITVNTGTKAGVITDLVLLWTVGIRPVLVHGGGPEINSWLAKLGIEPNFKGDCESQTASGKAVGLSGKDGNLLRARQMVEKDIGFVGEVTRVDPTLLKSLVNSGYLPVVATVATDETGQALNVNADTAAGEIAAALQAEKLILMTDVPGVLKDKNDVATKYNELNIRECRQLTEEGIIAGGMIPKVQCCIRCLSQGVNAAHIIDGRSTHSILMELLTDEGVGTMITG